MSNGCGGSDVRNPTKILLPLSLPFSPPHCSFLSSFLFFCLPAIISLPSYKIEKFRIGNLERRKSYIRRHNPRDASSLIPRFALAPLSFTVMQRNVVLRATAMCIILVIVVEELPLDPWGKARTSNTYRKEKESDRARRAFACGVHRTRG